MSGLRMMVVDDQADFVNGMAMVLRELGHEAHVFQAAEPAIEALDSLTPDVILSDLEMPGMNGWDLARHVRQRPGHEQIFLVAITGYGDEEHTRRAIEAGFHYRLVKPVGAHELEHFLDHLMSERKANHIGS